MPRGKTVVIFKGGKLDGQQFDEANTRVLRPKITAPSESFMAITPTNEIGIYTGKLNSNWFCFNTDVYEKQIRNDDTEPFVYLFKDKRIVNRCTAITKKGTRCSHPAVDGQSYCSETHKALVNPQLIDDPTSLRELINK
jgi:hypothetical protein